MSELNAMIYKINREKYESYDDFSREDLIDEIACLKDANNTVEEEVDELTEYVQGLEKFQAQQRIQFHAWVKENRFGGVAMTLSR